MSSIDITLKKTIFNDIYLPRLKCYDKRYEIYYGGAGSGKSVFVAQKLVLKALSERRKVLVIRKVAASLRDSCFQMVLDTLSNFKLLPYCKVNKTNFTVELPNGSLFLFKGIDNPEKLKSITNISDIWIEEASEITLDDFTQLDLRLRPKVSHPQLILSFNPVSKSNWTYKRFFIDEPDANTFILKTTYKDNKFLPKDYIMALESTIKTNPTYYKVYALGQFCNLDRNVYQNYKIEDFDETALSRMELICGLDFGFVNDPTAFIASLVDTDNKKIYVIKTWTDKGLTNPEIAAKIKMLGFSKSQIIADAAEPKSIEELKREGLVKIKPSRKGPDSIMAGIKALSEYQIYIKPHMTALIEEFENYTWQKNKEGEYIEKPIDDYNHLLDALRYSLQCLATKVKFLDKNSLGL